MLDLFNLSCPAKAVASDIKVFDIFCHAGLFHNSSLLKLLLMCSAAFIHFSVMICFIYFWGSLYKNVQSILVSLWGSMLDHALFLLYICYTLIISWCYLWYCYLLKQILLSALSVTVFWFVYADWTGFWTLMCPYKYSRLG